jgi:hypothetical protein
MACRYTNYGNPFTFLNISSPFGQLMAGLFVCVGWLTAPIMVLINNFVVA